MTRNNRSPPPREKRNTDCRPRNQDGFAAELGRQIAIHGDTPAHLLKAIAKRREPHAKALITHWTQGKTKPRHPNSMRVLARIEKRYRLPDGYFRAILWPKSPRVEAVRSVTANQQHLMRWHLPQDFDARAPEKRTEILGWIERNVLTCSTDLGRFLQTTCYSRFSLRMPTICDVPAQERHIARFSQNAGHDDVRRPRKPVRIEAPARLVAELTDLVAFKRAPLGLPGYSRNSGWSQYTASLRLTTYGRMFGALTASPKSSIKGLGASRRQLTMALFVMPAFWDWYLGWRERRRGFFNTNERNDLVDAISLLRVQTGWIRQSPKIARNLLPVRGLISEADIAEVNRNWDAACDKAIAHIRGRIREVRRVMRISRDPFYPIMVVLKSDSPLALYRKIADEVERTRPDPKQFPLAAAEASRAYLVLRMEMHLGLRQRNMRELLLCQRSETPKGERFLQKCRRGELRWSELEKGWEVYIPALSFKNWDSTFFRHGPFRVILPDVARLYDYIEEYIVRHRKVLLGDFKDPGTFFVRTLRSDSSGEYNCSGFAFLWKDIIKRHGIYNPYTRRGAIEGLLPHGPHSIRDVIATHMIKQTASYELAAFALHDTPDVMKAHYCRFLPEEKSALAAKVLNKVWER